MVEFLKKYLVYIRLMLNSQDFSGRLGGSVKRWLLSQLRSQSQGCEFIPSVGLTGPGTYKTDKQDLSKQTVGIFWLGVQFTQWLLANITVSGLGKLLIRLKLWLPLSTLYYCSGSHKMAPVYFFNSVTLCTRSGYLQCAEYLARFSYEYCLT